MNHVGLMIAWCGCGAKKGCYRRGALVNLGILMLSCSSRRMIAPCWIVFAAKGVIMARRRNKKNCDLPPYLYRYPDGFYLFERPDGKRFSLGNNKVRAVRLAIQLNQEMRSPSALEEQLMRKIKGDDLNLLSDVIERYITEFLPDRGLAVKTIGENTRMLRTASKALGEIATDQVSIKQVAGLLDPLPSNTSNKIRAQLSQFFAWAIAKGLTGSNPAAQTLKQREIVARQRLPLEQYLLIWQAAEPWFQNAGLSR
jgi:hypothetical protein